MKKILQKIYKRVKCSSLNVPENSLITANSKDWYKYGINKKIEAIEFITHIPANMLKIARSQRTTTKSYQRKRNYRNTTTL